MAIRNPGSGVALFCTAALLATPAFGEDTPRRQLEEVTVTAERQEASIQDTSISITAFTSESLDEFGIRNQSDLQNMIPATTIQPYDSAVRGVGRNFRNLGGDPGVATYMNGIYSEDLYTATIGSLWDVDRIEVLRGPQGTLYGRNAVGGAMNFIYKRPSDTFEASFKAIAGDYGTNDWYGVVSGPLIEDTLAYRVTGSARNHDGWIREASGLGPDLDSGNEDNIALQLEWNISDNMNVNVRQNVARVDRVMGAANGAGIINLTGEFPTSDQRNNFSVTNGLRRIDPTQVDPTQSDFDMRNIDPNHPTFTYTNPTTGENFLAQRDRVGVDSTPYLQNIGQSITYDPTECLFLDRENIKGKDLCTHTNGLNNETFDQQGTQLEFTWDINDSMTFVYLFGYNDLFYERTTDDDNYASLEHDRQFYVNHEAEYVSHELQLFWDAGEDLTFTSGVFFYDSTIDQRYDFYSSVRQFNIDNPAYSLDSILAAAAPGAVPGDPPLTFLAGATPIDVLSGARAAAIAGTPVGQSTLVTGAWLGNDSLGEIPHGPVTPATDLHALNKTEREAMAVYTQGVWNMTDKLTLTLGVRWAEDDVKGREDLARYAESGAVLDAVGIPLYLANILRGAIDPATLQPTGVIEPWKSGVPIGFGLHREVERVDQKTTWRVNLDYDITDSMMFYGNMTTGYRSGGFNLAFFSQTPEYEPEELTAFELGMKGQFFSNTLQVNASLYRYDYESIHTFTVEACPTTPPPGGFQSACAVSDSTTSVNAAPGAEVNGFEVEGTWLATDRLTLGGNYSFTDSEYTESFFTVDGSDPTIPGDLYTGAAEEQQRARDIKGNSLRQVPENKASLFGTYRYPLSSGGSVDLVANWSWIDDVWFSQFQTDLDKAPAYDRLDLRATWTNSDETIVISAFVNNVMDDIGIRVIQRYGGDEGYRRTAQVTEPRLYGVEFTWNLR